MFAERLALCLLPSDVISDEFEKLEEAATDADDPVRDHLPVSYTHLTLPTILRV